MHHVGLKCLICLQQLHTGKCAHDDGETTCYVLRDVATASSGECTTNCEEDCDTLSCTTNFGGLTVDFSIRILPCNDPPAANIQFSGGFSFDQDFSRTRQGTIDGGTVDVTLYHPDDHTIELEV